MKSNFLLLILVSLTFSCCHLENKFYIRGRIIDIESKKPINNVGLKLIYKPSHHIGKRPLIKTNINGIFNDTTIISLQQYKSITIKTIKKGYLRKEITTEKVQWKIKRSFMKTEFYVDFGNIELNKIK